MALYKRPIPSLFATIHQYPPGEIERINGALEAQYHEDIIIDEAAEAIVSALGPYIPPAPSRGWRPRMVQSMTPWRSRLEAYTFGDGDAADANNLFIGWCDRLRRANPDYVTVAIEIFEWGHVRPREFTAEQIQSVVAASIDGNVPHGPVPWSSSFTKVAAAATHADDLDGRSVVLPQVIWDSRVSYAVARLSSCALAAREQILDYLKRRLLVVPGRGGNRTIGKEWQVALSQQGWSFATGSWMLRHRRFWRSQIV